MLVGDWAAQFDRQVRNAARRIQLVGRQRGGGAGVDAAGAGSATVGRRGIGVEREGRQQFAEEEPGTEGLVDQAGVLADPAESGLPSVGSLQQRGGVDAGAPLVVGAEL